MHMAGLCATVLYAFLSTVLALPVRIPGEPTGVISRRTCALELPLHKRNITPRSTEVLLAGSVGLGDYDDTIYTVSVVVGNTTTAVNLDTGSSDLWVMSSACESTKCQQSTVASYATSALQSIGASVNLTYGDSTSETYAAGPVGLADVTLAGLSMASQPFAAVNSTTNTAVTEGSAGIIGLGFPSQSYILNAVVNEEFDSPSTTDEFVSHISTYGPLVSRLAEAGVIEQPMFTVTLQRDGEATGQLTIGGLPDGVDDSLITWVPVRLYSTADGGLAAPTFASDEVYPLRWEVPIENVYLDGKELANSSVQPDGVTTNFVDALVDTGNSAIRGPSDVVSSILSTVSSAYAANSAAQPILDCTSTHTLTFQIGGQMFSVNPQDLVSRNGTSNSTTECVANNIVSTDPPSYGSLFQWSLGVPFLKSNLVVFYYGNLTVPSADPPRMGFLSLAGNLTDLKGNVDAASENGDVQVNEAAPTASSVESITVTVASTSTAHQNTASVVSYQGTSSARPTNVQRASLSVGVWFTSLLVLCFIM